MVGARHHVRPISGSSAENVIAQKVGGERQKSLDWGRPGRQKPPPLFFEIREAGVAFDVRDLLLSLL